MPPAAQLSKHALILAGSDVLLTHTLSRRNRAMTRDSDADKDDSEGDDSQHQARSSRHNTHFGPPRIANRCKQKKRSAEVIDSGADSTTNSKFRRIHKKGASAGSHDLTSRHSTASPSVMRGSGGGPAAELTVPRPPSSSATSTRKVTPKPKGGDYCSEVLIVMKRSWVELKAWLAVVDAYPDGGVLSIWAVEAWQRANKYVYPDSLPFEFEDGIRSTVRPIAMQIYISANTF